MLTRDLLSANCKVGTPAHSAVSAAAHGISIDRHTRHALPLRGAQSQPVTRSHGAAACPPPLPGPTSQSRRHLRSRRPATRRPRPPRHRGPSQLARCACTLVPPACLPAHGISVLLTVCVHGIPSSLADAFSLLIRSLLGVSALSGSARQASCRIFMSVFTPVSLVMHRFSIGPALTLARPHLRRFLYPSILCVLSRGYI